MTFRKLCLLALATLGLGAPAQAQSAVEFCPADIDASCLSAVADHIINAEADPTARRELALRYAAMLLPKAPDHATRLIETYTANADWRSLRRMADAFAAAGQTEPAGKLIWAATETLAEAPPTSRYKALDMLPMAEDAAEIGDMDLARRIHGAVAPHLPKERGRHITLSKGLRLARLMALYGWPEDAHPILETLYQTAKSVPQDSQQYGLLLTHLTSVSVLAEYDKLHRKAENDISEFLDLAAPKARKLVQSSHVTALAEAGRVEDAIGRAREYGLSFDTAIQNMSSLLFQDTSMLFLETESDYFPRISDDTLRRYEAMLTAIESPALKAVFLQNLARHILTERHDEGIDTLLDRVTDPRQRSVLVFQLMLYHADERKDAATAADLYFSEMPSLIPEVPSLGQYEISLTAQGVLEAGDVERGGQLADVVLRLWIADHKNRHRRVDRALVAALAAAGDEDRVTMWSEASDDPGHKLDVLAWSLRGQANAGRFGNKDIIFGQLEDLLPLISDTKDEPPAYWPKDRPNPTPREMARNTVNSLRADMVAALAEHDRLAEAADAFAEISDNEPYPWRAQLAIANAFARTANTQEATEAKRVILDKALDGTIGEQMPAMINAMHP
ncbi:hypothetical protein SAMN05444398_10546 [Roseovarius pacificus]|uniref:Tetratricopeptide repeat-containing protein n=1 Tax=Roseovarius pacificus TaxID=337701 RepID=A0A1M7CZG9_9RHOB|nr:hypothetical protein [Roseovarius pacificus]GGO56285.1 hypothetical protein GCM10011315_20720 [Roseovarius pacificus]SHL72545.1 hypothetical protein SAMN05444398_10546 [Roseovarius pacificus]